MAISLDGCQFLGAAVEKGYCLNAVIVAFLEAAG